LAEQRHWQQASARFFQAWKQAAQLAGPYYFGDGSDASVGLASAKNDLRPNLEKISNAIGAISSGQGVFLAVLYSFYNDEDAQELLQRAGVKGMADIASRLDLPRRQLIAELLVNYNGW